MNSKRCKKQDAPVLRRYGQEGDFPTVLFTFQEVLHWDLDRTYLSQALVNAAYDKLKKENVEAFAKLTNTWWGDVTPTDKGYQVTIHPSELD